MATVLIGGVFLFQSGLFVARVACHNWLRSSITKNASCVMEESGWHGRSAVLFGGGAGCREARLAGIRALNKYVVGILHYNQTQSPERRKAIVDDALKAMSSPGTRHLLSECKLEHLPWYRTNETFRRETSHWSHVAVREGINFYEKSEPVSCR